jgi:hypothetical protein
MRPPTTATVSNTLLKPTRVRESSQIQIAAITQTTVIIIKGVGLANTALEVFKKIEPVPPEVKGIP